MGSLVQANCNRCNFSKDLQLGAGRRTFKETAMWPVWCTACGNLSVANHKKPSLVCAECGSNDVKRSEDPEVWSGDGQSSAALTWSLGTEKGEPIERNWFERLLGRPPKYRIKYIDLRLTDGTYLCPSCKKFSLRFQLIGLFD